LTTEEKLKHFQDICMEDARDRSAKMLDDYMAALEKSFEEHTADAKRRADMQVAMETEKLEREMNKRLSIAQLDLKREVSHKQEELKDKLFVELKDLLENFMDTADYQRLLECQVKAAKEFAGDAELIIYMDPSDQDKLQRIALHHNATIKVSEYSFMGGTRAVIPAKHILIDNSFETKLKEARHEFKFDLGGK
jgi:vacuolar-type H+-ATPase subunit E/Vma4